MIIQAKRVFFFILTFMLMLSTDTLVYSLAASDAIKPQKPTTLSAKVLSSSSIALNWRDNSDNETRFRIDRKLGDGSFRKFATVGANTKSYKDTGLQANTAYSYRVRAENSAGKSGFSGKVTETTKSGCNKTPKTHKPVSHSLVVFIRSIELAGIIRITKPVLGLIVSWVMAHSENLPLSVQIQKAIRIRVYKPIPLIRIGFGRKILLVSPAFLTKLRKPRNRVQQNPKNPQTCQPKSCRLHP